jgi:hypothetical protein
MVQLLTATPLAKYEVAAIDCGPPKIAKPVESTPTLPLTGGEFIFALQRMTYFDSLI